MSLPKIEPSAAVRQAAVHIRSVLEALVEVGFTEQQAYDMTLMLWDDMVGSSYDPSVVYFDGDDD